MVALLVVSVALLGAGLAAPELLDRPRSREARQVLNGLAFESTDGAASWWTTVLLLLVALIAWLNGKVASDSAQRPDALRWRVLAGLLLWSSFDHDTQVHVAAGRFVARTTDLPGQFDPLAVLIGTAALLAWLPMLLRAERSVRLGAAVGAALLVAGGWAADSLTGGDGGVRWLAAEAGLGWAGLIVLLRVMDQMRPRDTKPSPSATAEPG